MRTSVCLVSLLTRKPKKVLVTLTALAPQLFRDLVVRSFCVSRFKVNKKAQDSFWFAPSVCLVSLLTRKPKKARFTEC